MALSIQAQQEEMNRAFTTSCNELLVAQNDEQFNNSIGELERSSLSVDRRTTLFVMAAVLHLQTAAHHQKYLTINGNKITIKPAWTTLLGRLNQSESNNRIIHLNNFNGGPNALDRALWVLAYAGRPDFEMTILLTLAKALFGAQNFVVFNGSPKKSTEPTPIQGEGDGCSFEFSPEGILHYDIPLLLGTIPVRTDRLLVQLQVTTGSYIECDITPDDNSNHNCLRNKIIRQETISQGNMTIYTIHASITLLSSVNETPIKISMQIPKDVVKRGMNARKRCTFQISVLPRQPCQDTRPPSPAQESTYDVEFRMVATNGVEIRNIEAN